VADFFPSTQGDDPVVVTHSARVDLGGCLLTSRAARCGRPPSPRA